MAWLSRVNFIASDTLSFSDINNLGNDIRAWGGNVNGGGYVLSNVVLSAFDLSTCFGLPISTGVSGLGTGVATFLGTPSSANLAAALTDETGTGALVFGTSPTFTTSAVIPLVNGGTAVSSTLTLQSTSGAGSSDAIIFKTASQSEKMRITTGGNVGIGTASPLAKLSVGAGSLSDANVPVQISSAGSTTSQWFGANKNGGYGLLVGYNESSGSLGGIGGIIRQVNTDPLGFVVNNTTRAMTIISTGDVGIGTTSPSAKTHIVGSDILYGENSADAVNRPTISLGWNSTTQARLGLTYFSGAPTLGWSLETRDAGASVAAVTITGAGNVGIGAASPGAKLTVFGNNGTFGMSAFFSLSSSVAGIAMGNTGTVGYIQGATTATSGLSAAIGLQVNGGNVGIGTASPNYKLDLFTDSAGKPGVGGLWTVVSDERIKTDITPADLDRCYEIVKSVPLKHFGFAPGVYTDDQINDKHSLGWIAQDVQKVFSKAVSVKPFTLNTAIPDGTEEYTEQDFTLETVEKTETSIQVINGKPVRVSKVVASENKVLLFDTVDVTDEAGAVVMDGDKPLTYQMPRMVTKTRNKVRHDVIEDCLDLNGGQMIAALYGAVQALMLQVESLKAGN